MSEILSLPPPSEPFQKPKKRRKLWVTMGIPVVILASLAIASVSLVDEEVVANIVVAETRNPRALELMKPEAEAVVSQKNEQMIQLMVNGQLRQLITPDTMGIHFTLDVTEGIQNPDQHGSAQTISANITVDQSQKQAFLKQLRQFYEYAAQPESYGFQPGKGWSFLRYEAGQAIHESDFESAYTSLIQQLQTNSSSPEFNIQTTTLNTTKERDAIKIYQRILKLVRQPITVQIADEELTLDLQSSKDYVIVNGSDVSINVSKVKEWVQFLADQWYIAPSEVRLTGIEETTYNREKAVVEGEFKEGRRIDVDQVVQDILNTLHQSERQVSISLLEIPVKVYSELDGQELQIVSVGWSEYSHGNAPSRVHNVKTGINRLNGLIVRPGEEISFNKLTGPINSEFTEGYAIFGDTAGKSLGGGICQVSTTFYRGLLNAGVPIKMRQNHSWDLTYYREGGYGLDATIFPSAGLDVKAVNDYGSHLFFYSYTRPDIEQAFVLVYGIPDGRKVDLKPRQEYKPTYGAKTIIWDNQVTYADGTERDEEIVSRYRK